MFVHGTLIAYTITDVVDWKTHLAGKDTTDQYLIYGRGISSIKNSCSNMQTLFTDCNELRSNNETYYNDKNERFFSAIRLQNFTTHGEMRKYNLLADYKCNENL